MTKITPDHARTLAILREMAKGKALDLPTGQRIKMADNMAVGFAHKNAQTGVEMISELAEMTFRELNDVLNQHNIGPPIF